MSESREKFLTNFGRYREIRKRDYSGNYVMESFYIPMRDGTKIAVDLILPEDIDTKKIARKYPCYCIRQDIGGDPNAEHFSNG